MSPSTNPSLITRLSNRQDMRAWEQFDQLYRPMLLRVALKRGLQTSDAEEVVQDVLLTVLQSIHQYQSNGHVGSFRSWLHTMAHRKAINRLLRDHRNRGSGRTEVFEQLHQLPDRESNSILHELNLEFRRQCFIAASEAVRMRCDSLTWAAFWKTAVQQLSGEEVALELGIKIGAVYVAKSRVQARIRDYVLSQTSLWEQGESS